MSPYTPQTWVDFDVTKPVSAARMTVIENGLSTAQGLAETVQSNLAVIRNSPINLADPNYGAVNGGSIDTPMTLAKTALGANGGEVYIPPGDYTFSSLPTFKDTRNVIIRGAGGLTAGAASATRLTYTGSGSRAIDARSTYGFKLKDLQLLYNQSGTILSNGYIDFQHSDVAGSDSAYMVLENVHIQGAGARGGVYLLNLTDSIIGSFRDCLFAQSQYAVHGKTADANYSIKMEFDNCTFVSQVVQHAVNGGEAWTFKSCTFENLVDASGAAVGAGAFTQTAGVTYTKDLSFEGCWFGDTGANVGDWITFRGSGLNLTNNFVGGGNPYGVRLRLGSTTGVHITGNDFYQAITAGVTAAGTGNADWLIAGNTFSTSPGVLLTTTPDRSIIDTGAGVVVTGATSVGFTAVTAASTANSNLFVDSADNKLKYKDSGGTTNLLY